MHDPHTLAFSIPYPWYAKGHKPWPRKYRKHLDRRAAYGSASIARDIYNSMPPDVQKKCSVTSPKGYRDSFIDIWHVDPSGDNCPDWCWPSLTPEQQEKIRNYAWSEGRDPVFLQVGLRQVDRPEKVDVLLRNATWSVATLLKIPVSGDDVARAVAHLGFNAHDNLRGILAFQPGYHTNFPDEPENGREDAAVRLFTCIARHLLRERRRWYQHPRWRFWRWSVRILPLRRLHRAIVEKCVKCGKRVGFKTPTSSCWDSRPRPWYQRLFFSSGELTCGRCSPCEMRVSSTGTPVELPST